MAFDAKNFVTNALNAADLLQGYIDIASEKLDELTPAQKRNVLKELETTTPDKEDPEAAGAKAILLVLLR